MDFGIFDTHVLIFFEVKLKKIEILMYKIESFVKKKMIQSQHKLNFFLILDLISNLRLSLSSTSIYIYIFLS